MVRRAWIVSNGDSNQAMGYIRDNFDSPDEFWMNDDPELPLVRSRHCPAWSTCREAIPKLSQGKGGGEATAVSLTLWSVGIGVLFQ